MKKQQSWTVQLLIVHETKRGLIDNVFYSVKIFVLYLIIFKKHEDIY